MAKNVWIKMGDTAKLAMFSKILLRAATDLPFRERLLASGLSAIAAFKEQGDVELPPDFSITCIDEHDSQQDTNRVIMKLPKYSSKGTPSPSDTQASRTNVPCTYPWWAGRKQG